MTNESADHREDAFSVYFRVNCMPKSSLVYLTRTLKGRRTEVRR